MKLLSIQYLRGLAALLVVIYHIFVQVNRLGRPEQAPEFFSGGVDIFFVISGFIMWYTTFDRDVGVEKFFWYRVIRIVPLYWIVTTFYLAVLLVRPAFMHSAKFDLFHIMASYLFIPLAHPAFPAIMWPLVIPGWTLNYEMFFYFWFGLSLIFPATVRAVVVVAILSLMVGIQAFRPSQNPILAFYSSSIIIEFAFGVVLGYLCTSGISFSPRSSTLMVLLGCLALVMGSYAGLSALPRAIGIGVPALLIVAGAVFYERARNVIEYGFAKLIGDASYSIYLSHAAVLSAVGTLWHHAKLPAPSMPIGLVLFSLTSVILVLIIGVGLYWLVERPLLRLFSGRFRQRNSYG